MQKGDSVRLTIVSSGMGGDGVAKYDGMTVFVPAALPGEEVMAQVVEVKKQYARARVYKLLNASPDRVEPLCPIYYRCGGCEMQHIAYRRQSEIKRGWVRDCIAKECRVTPDVAEVVTDGRQYGYRNKIQVPLAVVDGKVCAGYFRPESHQIVPFGKVESKTLGDCPLNDRAMQTIVDLFCDWVHRYCLDVYDETAHRGLLRHLVVRRVGDAYAITVVVNGNRLPAADRLIETFCAHGLRFSLYLSINDKPTNVILGNRIKTLYGDRRLRQQIMGVTCEVSPLSFMQVNDGVRDALYGHIRSIVSRYARCALIDAYSGVGVTTNLLAPYVDRAVGIEIVPQAVADADRLAMLNGNADKIENICGDCRKVLPEAIGRLGGNYEIACEMRLTHEAFDAIARGAKRYELRLCDAKRAALCAGDTIRFTDCSDGRILDAEATELTRFSDFGALYDALNGKGICSGGDTVQRDAFVASMGAYYSEEQIGRCGALAIGLRVKCTPVVILDPPRKGCDYGVIETIVAALPHCVIYVSCNPATLARDLKYLLAAYQIESITPFDMFPNCGHVECVTTMIRKDNGKSIFLNADLG